MNRLNKPAEYDSYEIEEPSDEERAESSSEDELDILLNGTADQKRKLIREYLTGESESSSGDEFEKEMEAELSSTMKSMEGTWAPAVSAESSGTNANSATPVLPQTQMYDQIYFDSEDSEEEDTPSSSTGRRRKQRTIPTNDELLYDPDEDDRDQAWVDAKRRGYGSDRRRQQAFSLRGQQSSSLPSSDAVLNCPACMTTLCLDCQRHDKYRTQYRAMFVMNCIVNKEEVLRYKTQNERKQRNRKRRKGQQEATTPPPPSSSSSTAAAAAAVQVVGPGPRGMDGEEVYHPVQCTECSTEVAVYDKDEVYHFFNILASHC